MSISRKLQAKLDNYSIESSDYLKWHSELKEIGFLNESINVVIFSDQASELVAAILENCRELKTEFQFSSEHIEILGSSFTPVENIRALLHIAREGKITNFIFNHEQICRIIFIAGIDAILIIAENKENLSRFKFSKFQLYNLVAEIRGYSNIQTLLMNQELLLSSKLSPDQIIEFIGCNDGYVKLNEYLIQHVESKNQEIEEKIDLIELEALEVYSAEDAVFNASNKDFVVVERVDTNQNSDMELKPSSPALPLSICAWPYPLFDYSFNFLWYPEEINRSLANDLEYNLDVMRYSPEQKRIFTHLKLDIGHVVEFKKILNELINLQYTDFMIYQIALNGGLESLKSVLSLSTEQTLQNLGFTFTPAEMTEIMAQNAGMKTIGKIITYHRFLKIYDLTDGEIVKIAGCADGYKNIDLLVLYFREIRSIGLDKNDFLPFLSRHDGGDQQSRNDFEEVIQKHSLKIKKLEAEEARLIYGSLQPVRQMTESKLETENTTDVDSCSEEVDLQIKSVHIDRRLTQADDVLTDSEEDEAEIEYFLNNYTLLGEERSGSSVGTKHAQSPDIFFSATSSKRRKQNNEKSCALLDYVESNLNQQDSLSPAPKTF